jgi:hypothetical protein
MALTIPVEAGVFVLLRAYFAWNTNIDVTLLSVPGEGGPNLREGRLDGEI